jgi:hypothetical protein
LIEPGFAENRNIEESRLIYFSYEKADNRRRQKNGCQKKDSVELD